MIITMNWLNLWIANQMFRCSIKSGGLYQNDENGVGGGGGGGSGEGDIDGGSDSYVRVG